MWKSSKHQYASFKHFSFCAFDSFTDTQVLPTYETNSKTLNWFLGKKEKVFCYQEMFLLIHFLSRSVFFWLLPAKQAKYKWNEMEQKIIKTIFSNEKLTETIERMCVCVLRARESERMIWFFFMWHLFFGEQRFAWNLCGTNKLLKISTLIQESHKSKLKTVKK